MQRSVDNLRAENAAIAQAKAAARGHDPAALTARLDVLEKKTPGRAADTGRQECGAFDAAYQKLQAGQYADARRLFRTYVQTFPQDDKADNAQYFVGESFYKEKDYDHAIAEFQKVIDTWPKGDMAENAYMGAGSAALEEMECRVAKVYLTELLKHFPQSQFAKTAKAKLETIAKKAKDPKVCKPG